MMAQGAENPTDAVHRTNAGSTRTGHAANDDNSYLSQISCHAIQQHINILQGFQNSDLRYSTKNVSCYS